MVPMHHHRRAIFKQHNAFQLFGRVCRDILLCRQHKCILGREESQRQLIQVQIGTGQGVLRAGLRKFRDQIHPQIGCGGCDPNVFFLLNGVLQQFLFATFQRVKHLIHIPQEYFTLGIESNALGVTVKQLHTQFFFQAGNGSAQRRRRNIQGFRSS